MAAKVWPESLDFSTKCAKTILIWLIGRVRGELVVVLGAGEGKGEAR